MFEGYVPKAIQQKIAAGQDVYIKDNGYDIMGSVSGISDEISIDTGMFCAQVTFQEPLDSVKLIVAYVHTDTLRDVFCVPNAIIERQDEKTFIWKVEAGRALKQQIRIGERDGYGAVVLDGLDRGDLVVYKGFTQLLENDLVNIIESIENPGAQI